MRRNILDFGEVVGRLSSMSPERTFEPSTCPSECPFLDRNYFGTWVTTEDHRTHLLPRARCRRNQPWGPWVSWTDLEPEIAGHNPEDSGPSWRGFKRRRDCPLPVTVPAPEEKE